MEAVIIEPRPLIHEGIPLPDIHFIDKPAGYAVREGDRYIDYCERNVRLRLRDHGLSDTKAQGELVSEVDRALLRIQRECRVDVSIALAGWPLGILEYGNRRLLINDGASVLEAKEGPFDNIHSFLLAQFGPEALPYLIGWLQRARENIGIEEILPGQIVFLIGKAGIGKSLLQKYITRLLGGRDANPYDYLRGGTFNEDLFESAHLVVEDRFFEGGKGKSREFGAAIKEIAVNAVHRCHGKYKKAFAAWPKWRMTISMNDESENLNMLPPLDESLRDKLMLFKVSAPVFPTNMATVEGWRQWDEIVKAELPGFAHYVDNFDLGDIAAPRFGVNAWHDPEILDEEAESSTEMVFLQHLVHDMHLHPDVEDAWEGTAVELQRLLEDEVSFSHMHTRKLLGWGARACGTYLGRLAKRYPDCISFKLYPKFLRLFRIEISM